MKNKRFLILGMLLMLVLSGCQARKTSVEYLIGVSLSNLSEQRQLVLKKEMETEAAKYGNVKLIFSDASSGSYKQKKDIQRFLGYEIDLLIITPTNVEEMRPVVNEVYEKLPVILLDRVAEGYRYSLFIGPDNQMAGEKAGEAVLDLLENMEVENPLVLELKSNHYAIQERSRIWNQVMEEAGVPVRRYMVKTATSDSAEDAIDKNIQILKDVDVIFAHNDYMAAGAKRSLEKIWRRDIQIVGMDGFSGENEGLELVKRGRLQATVACPVGGREAVQNAVAILNHKDMDLENILLQSQIVTEENVEEFWKKE